MIKAIFFDIDGTLISKNNPRLSHKTIESLNELRSKGIKLCIASGRHKLEIEQLGLNKDFIFDCYVTLNGAYCYNDKEVIYKNPIDKDDVKIISDYASKENISCMFALSDEAYVNLINDNTRKAQEAISSPIPLKRDINDFIDEDIYLIDPYVDDVSKFLDITKNCKATRWHDLAFDLIPSNGGKMVGIKAVLDYYDLKPIEILAFGDGLNDIEMFEYAGISIAMGNALNEVKSKATFVCPSVDDDGIYEALKQMKII